jgi:asparaginyl-tRNA synthetase
MDEAKMIRSPHYIQNLSQYVGQTVTLQGWLYNMRSSGKLHFLEMRDGTGICQCVVIKSEVSEEIFETGKRLTQESSIIVTGTVREDKRSPGGFEITVKDLQIVALSKDYPISPKEHGVAFLMDQRHLWLRSRRQAIIMRIRSTLVKAIRDYFDHQGFTLLDAPIFTPNACEGTSTLFETKYFDNSAYLTQSGQLYMEAGAMALGKVYCFGPTFRAEKSKTRRHLTEFWMVEPEVAYFDLDDDMLLMEDMVVYLVEQVLKKHEADLVELERNVEPLKKVKKPFPRLSYNEAVEILKSRGINFTWGNDFRGYDEKGEKVHIAAPPTLLVSAIGVMKDAAQAISIDVKMAGDILYVLGETNKELGASEYFAVLAGKKATTVTGGELPEISGKK